MFNGRKSSQRSMASFYNHENGTINGKSPQLILHNDSSLSYH